MSNQGTLALMPVTKFRENRTTNFLLTLRDMRSAQERDLGVVMKQILKRINSSTKSPCRFDENFLALVYHGTTDYAVYIQCTGHNPVGFNRQYFSNKTSLGGRLLKMAYLELIEQSHGAVAKSKFDSKIIADGWLALNDPTQEYYQ